VDRLPAVAPAPAEATVPAAATGVAGHARPSAEASATATTGADRRRSRRSADGAAPAAEPDVTGGAAHREAEADGQAGAVPVDQAAGERLERGAVDAAGTPPTRRRRKAAATDAAAEAPTATGPAAAPDANVAGTGARPARGTRRSATPKTSAKD
jgi:hypothetical protein